MCQNGFWPVRLIALLVAILPAASACTPSFSAGLALPSTSPIPPTIAPTEVPLPTSTAATPPPPYATEAAARRAAIATRAAASPFPTAAPASVQIGEPSVATAQRDGLKLEVRLLTNAYLAGEGGRAEVTLCNGGPETVFVQSTGDGIGGLAILDERDQEPAPWPWLTLPMPGMPRGPVELSPGQTFTSSLAFQVPPLDQATGHNYTLWAEVRFARPDPVESRGPDNLLLRLEAGPIPLQVAAPNAAQQLLAEFSVDRDMWSLRVRDGRGQTPFGPFWGVLEAVSANGAQMRPLKDDADGIWDGSLDPYLSQNGTAVAVRAWIAAPGYVTAAATEPMPGVDSEAATFYTGEPPVSQHYDSVQAAQNHSRYALYGPDGLPAGGRIEDVQVDTWGPENSYRLKMTQFYRLPGDKWLELGQQSTTEPYAGFGWGEARYDAEAEIVAVRQTTGYAIRRFGWWMLNWKCGNTGLELRAPAGVLSLEELVAVAGRVRSPEGRCPPVPTPGRPTASPAPATPVPTPTSTMAPVPPTATAVTADPLALAQEALAAYQPVADAQPVVSTSSSSSADWLGSGGEPATMVICSSRCSCPTHCTLTDRTPGCSRQMADAGTYRCR